MHVWLRIFLTVLGVLIAWQPGGETVTTAHVHQAREELCRFEWQTIA